MATPSANRRGAAASQPPPAQSSGDPSGASPAGAAKYLGDLPSRGLLSSTVLSSNLGGIRVYLCDHDTSPPVAERTSDGRASAKKANVASGSTSPRRDGLKTLPSDKELQSFTVDKLRALLKEKGLPAKGKKDELILRLKGD